MSAAWDVVLASLSEEFGKEEVDRCIKPLRVVAITPTAVRLQAPNKFFLDCVSDKLLATLRQSVARVLGSRQVLFEVSNRAQGELFPLKSLTRKGSPVIGTFLPAFTFENFVVGPNNQFAHATAKAVAKRTGDHYNPLFIYGASGLGKTHLVNAIGHYILERNPAARVAYLPAETFVNELISAIRRERTDQFKSRFRSVELLIIDDVQFLAGRERTQEEFFHTFNAVYERGCQIVLTSDTMPQDIAGLAERLRNRFEWGLIADVQPPDLETRIAILEKKADAEGISLPPDVASFVGTHIDSNVRELEGTLTRLGALASVNKTPITLELAKEVLHNILKRREQTVTVDAILSAVCDQFSVRHADLRSKRRTRNVAVPRQLAMYLVRKLLLLSYPSIGALFGGRDHSTVIHAVSVTERRTKEDPGFQATVERVERSIQEQ